MRVPWVGLSSLRPLGDANQNPFHWEVTEPGIDTAHNRNNVPIGLATDRDTRTRSAVSLERLTYVAASRSNAAALMRISSPRASGFVATSMARCSSMIPARSSLRMSRSNVCMPLSDVLM